MPLRASYAITFGAILALLPLRGIARADEVDESDAIFEEHVDSYKTARPWFSLQISGTPHALGGPASPLSQGVVSQGYQIEVGVQPAFLQSLGVLEIGPSAGVYPAIKTPAANPGYRITPNYWSIYGFGAQARYQLRYFQEQPVVPFIGFDIQSLHYRFTGTQPAQATLDGGTAGALFLLNWLDTDAAQSLYHDFGIARSYVVAEAQELTGGGPNLSVSGVSFYAGLRCEF